MADRRIAVFVDYENIRISLRENFVPKVDAEAIAAAIQRLVEEYGEWRGGTVYADWSKNKRDARSFEDAGFQARMVLPKRGGTDRSDMVMSLDIHECLVGKADEVNTIVIVSGDSDFQEVIRRAKDKGVWVLVVASAPNTAAGIVSVADQFVAIEARMGLQPRDEVEMEHSLPDRDWTVFVELLAGLESTNKYVGVRKFLDEWMASDPHRFGESRSDRRGYLRDAENERIVGIYQVSVVLAGGRDRQVAAVRLNRDHPVVTAALGMVAEQAVAGASADFSSDAQPADT
jgi:uncharacterized protein (TIGR00288 family)